MDIDRASFWPRLPSILKAISEAQFISVDLEMSGIAVEKAESSPNPSLQQIYQDAKVAAETFTILQFGLTCACWDPEEEAYVTKTFNLPVHPGFAGGDGASQQLSHTVDRQVTLSSKTIAFLQEQGFSFADVFSKGVPYLSVAEAARKDVIAFVENKDQDGARIDVSQLPQQARAFYSNIRTRMEGWANRQFHEANTRPLRIENPHGGRLNSLQKRLIYQLVETSLQGCRAYSRAGSSYMEIVELEANEQRVSGHVKAQRKQAVVRQTGLRYVWDAICRRLFADKIDPDLIVGEDPAKIIQLRKDLKEYERRLRNQSPIFVGHRFLWDLCFLHSTFVGRLPESVEDFRTVVGEQLPRIVDTKYLFTRGGHEMMPDQNLAECFAAVMAEKLPAVRPDPLYSYHRPCPHRAGYDSYMTAVIFIKKSYQLFQTKQGCEFLAAEDSAEALALSRSDRSLKKPPPPRPLRPSSLVYQVPRHAPVVPPALTISRSVNKVSLLDDNGDDDTVARLAFYAPLRPEVLSVKMTAPSTEEIKPVGPAKVPAWGGTFWKRYGNKSRVGPLGVILYTGRVAEENLL